MWTGRWDSQIIGKRKQSLRASGGQVENSKDGSEETKHGFDKL